VVLLKSVTAGGLLFGTSGASLKGRELAENPVACINVYWRETMRQVTVVGPVVALPDAESDALFEDRARGARAVAAASEQSAPLDDPQALERRVNELLAGDARIQRPPQWHGYLLNPTTVEFWQGSTERLHRRLRFERETPGSPWSSHRMQP
jgi:pyridoxine/pyridoxamine 5'-phosphate oxidase